MARIKYGVFIKFCVFSKNSQIFATSPSSPVLDCYVLHKKLPANRSDCTLALRALKVSYSDDVGEGGVAVTCDKHILHPVFCNPCSLAGTELPLVVEKCPAANRRDTFIGLSTFHICHSGHHKERGLHWIKKKKCCDNLNIISPSFSSYILL